MNLEDDLKYQSFPKKSKLNCTHCKTQLWEFPFQLSQKKITHFGDICTTCEIVKWGYYATKKLSKVNKIILLAADKESSWKTPRNIQEAK